MSNNTGFDLRGQRIVVTGASSGIGKSIARLLFQSGAHVGIHYYQRNAEAENLLKMIRTEGGIAEKVCANLKDRAQRERLIPEMINKLGGLDGFVNNAGAPQGNNLFPEITQMEWDDSLALNAEAPFFLAQKVFLYMQEHGGGRIINISSVGVKFGGSARTIHYAMAKSALEMLTVGMAKLGARHNILVNTVRAGVIDTPFWDDKSDEELKARVQLIPIGRSGKPFEVANMVCFLLSSSASFISGQTIAVSGGE